jgi:hypothetical protein
MTAEQAVTRASSETSGEMHRSAALAAGAAEAGTVAHANRNARPAMAGEATLKFRARMTAPFSGWISTLRSDWSPQAVQWFIGLPERGRIRQ